MAERRLHDCAAIADMMPPSPYSLRVTCKIEGNAGQTVELRKAVPQGYNDQILLLEATIQGRGGVPATLDGLYRDEDYAGQHSSVTIQYETPDRNAEMCSADIEMTS